MKTRTKSRHRITSTGKRLFGLGLLGYPERDLTYLLMTIIKAPGRRRHLAVTGKSTRFSLSC